MIAGRFVEGAEEPSPAMSTVRLLDDGVDGAVVSERSAFSFCILLYSATDMT